MRRRKHFALMDLSLMLAMAGHAFMGAAIGLGFSFVLIFFDRFGLKPLIIHAADPQWTAVVFAGTMTLVFAVGSTLTGFVLTMMDKHK
jgi:uncharacterized membrane protein YqjE